MMVMEFDKYVSHRGLQMSGFFWRDQTGHEIDLLIENGGEFLPVEIKSGKTITSDYFAGLNYWKKISQHSGSMYLFYGGREDQRRRDVSVYSWKSMGELFQSLSI